MKKGWMRTHGARKNSTVNNFQVIGFCNVEIYTSVCPLLNATNLDSQDTYNHLWDQSRPTIVEMERKVRRKKGKIHISTEIESLVESLFLEESEEE